MWSSGLPYSPTGVIAFSSTDVIVFNRRHRLQPTSSSSIGVILCNRRQNHHQPTTISNRRPHLQSTSSSSTNVAIPTDGIVFNQRFFLEPTPSSSTPSSLSTDAKKSHFLKQYHHRFQQLTLPPKWSMRIKELSSVNGSDIELSRQRSSGTRLKTGGQPHLLE